MQLSSRIVLFLPSVATASPLSWESFILSICVSSFTWRYLNCRVVNTVYWLFASRWELIRKAHKTRTVCARGVIYDRVRLLCEWVRGASFLRPFLSFPIIRICTGRPVKNEWKLNWRIHFINKSIEITKAIVLHTPQRPQFFRWFLCRISAWPSLLVQSSNTVFEITLETNVFINSVNVVWYNLNW